MAGIPAPSSATSHNVAALLPKLYEDDPDLRYMGLNDLQQLLLASGPGLLIHDTHVSAKTVDGLLHSLQDSNGEVQNMAIKCLGPFVNKVSADQILCPLIDKISTLKIGDAVDNSIPALALRAIVVNLPHPTPGIARTKAVQEAYSAVSRALIPRLVGYMVIPPAIKNLPKPPKGMLQEDMDNGTDSNAIDVLTEVARSYGSMLQEAEVNALVKISLEILQHERTTSVLKKKAVVAIAALASSLSDVALSQFTSRLIELLRSPHLTKSKRKLYINLLGSLARAVPTKFGKHLKIIAPFVLTALSQQEIDDDLAALEETEERDPESDDVREAALIALETFFTYCSEDMKTYTSESIEAILRFLKYDPNLADDDDDDMDDDFAEDDTFGGDEDFEEEVGADDEDDTSWKVRRCAAKVTDVFIETRSKGDLLDNGTLYSQIAPALIARFKEREETVRVEVISALARLVRITGGRALTAQAAGTAGQASSTAPTSRKRRRGSSSVGSQEYLAARQIREIRLNTPPPGSAKSSLESLSPEIVKSVAQLLKGQPLPTKQASISLLKDLSEALQGRMSDYLAQTLDPVIDAIKSSSSGSAAAGSHVASANTYRIEALQFLKAVALAHSSQNLQPYLDKIIPAVVSAAKDKYTKVSVAALEAADAYLKTLTASGSKPTANDKAYIKQIYDAINNRINAPDSDTEVRRLAVRGMGALLGRTSLHQVLDPADKAAGYDLLLSRLKNELTRLSAVRASETAAILVQDPNDYPQGWAPTVAIELGAQLRKASRVLRGSSLQTLKALSLNASVAHIDSKTIKELLPLLLPTLHTGDLHLISSALLVLNAYVQKDPKTVVNKEFIVAFDTLLATTVVAGTTLDNLLILIRSIGEKGVGKDVMAKLLGETSMKSNPDTVGKVIANLLVSGGSKTGVKLESFVSEARGKHDDRRKGLALSVLGEAGFRLGPSSPLDPQLFIGFFKEKSDTVPIAAAVALGRAAGGNVSAYLPVILQSMGSSGSQYLLLHSVREILQQEGTESQIIPFAAQLWQNLFTASQVDDNRAIAAECIGRLAVLDPATYLPQLQNLLTNSNASTRGMVISALRFTFGDTDESYDSNLEPIIIGMLQTMLSEQDLENRRLAMTTLNSAAQHKPNLIVPHLDDLLPLCMNETQIREELIREVQMGPFKHKVDDGLEIRKSAYETIYSLLDIAFPLLDLPTLFARLTAGLTDDHDIRDLCTLLLHRLIVLAPSETASRLDNFVEPFKTLLAQKPKENAVKQEIDRIAEEQRHVVRVSLVLAKRWPDESSEAGRAWGGYWEWVRKEFNGLVKVVEDEAREKGN